MTERNVFDPGLEYEMVKSIQGTDALQARKEFHEKRIEQKMGMATLGALMLELVMTDPEIPLNTLFDLMDEHTNELGLSGKQKSIFRKLIKEFGGRREKQRALKKENLTPETVFMKRFHFAPKGSVKVEYGPITTNFILSSSSDYERIEGQRKTTRGVTLKSGGFFRRDYPDVTFSRALGEATKEVVRHEETHALKHLIDSVIGYESFKKELVKKIERLKETLLKTKDLGKTEHIVREILFLYVEGTSNRIKDEIFANLRAGVKMDKVASVLAKSDEHLGLYDYTKADRDRFEQFIQHSSLSVDQKDIVQKLVIDQFTNMYKRLVKDAVSVVVDLTTKQGFSSEQVLLFLNDVPLSLWKKEVSRLSNEAA